MFRYQAPNPYPQKKESWLSSLFSSPSSLSSPSVGKLVLPAQVYKDVQEEKFESKHTNIARGEVITHDGAQLSTVILTPKDDAKKADKEKHYVIKFNGNGGFYQNRLSEFDKESTNLGITIVGFNYRNVADSKLEPAEFQNLITDGIAEVQHLLDKGVPSEHILLDGHSLGGSIATKTAEHFHKIKKPVFLWNDRSFASLPKAAAGIISSPSLESVAEPVSWSLMSATAWNVDAANAYQTIPSQYKKYMTVIDDKDKSAGDGVISARASLHNTIYPQEKDSGKLTGYTFYSGRMFGHNLPRNRLKSVTHPEKSAEDIFEEHVQQIFQKKS